MSWDTKRCLRFLLADDEITVELEAVSSRSAAVLEALRLVFFSVTDEDVVVVDLLDSVLLLEPVAIHNRVFNDKSQSSKPTQSRNVLQRLTNLIIPRPSFRYFAPPLPSLHCLLLLPRLH